MNFEQRIFLALMIGWSVFMSQAYAQDVHTNSNYKVIAVEHMSLDLNLHLDEKYFEGKVDLTIKQLEEGQGQTLTLTLDTKGLIIRAAEISKGWQRMEKGLF